MRGLSQSAITLAPFVSTWNLWAAGWLMMTMTEKTQDQLAQGFGEHSRVHTESYSLNNLGFQVPSFSKPICPTIFRCISYNVGPKKQSDIFYAQSVCHVGHPSCSHSTLPLTSGQLLPSCPTVMALPASSPPSSVNETPLQCCLYLCLALTLFLCTIFGGATMSFPIRGQLPGSRGLFLLPLYLFNHPLPPKPCMMLVHSRDITRVYYIEIN